MAMDKIEIDFWAFHRSNPQVYMELRDLARRLRNAGRRRHGIAALFEVLRYNRALTTVGDDFELNNNYRALYARLLMKNEPELAGFFELRKRQPTYNQRRDPPVTLEEDPLAAEFE